MFLDGEHDHKALVSAIQTLVENGELNVEKDGEKVGDKSALGGILDDAVGQQLATISKNALLEG